MAKHETAAAHVTQQVVARVRGRVSAVKSRAVLDRILVNFILLD